MYTHPFRAALVAGLFGAGSACAQSTDSDFQAWNALAIAGPVTDDSRFLLWFDGHARFRDDASDLGVSIIRPALGWRATDKLDLWAGYARVVSRADGRANIEEDRFWQQATFPMPRFLGGGMGGRSRLEQRFRGAGEGVGWRFPQFVRWSRPLPAPKFSAVVWDELFVNLNDSEWGQRSGFDQNRLFIGAAWHVAPSARFETGYLNNVLDTATSAVQVNHILSLAFFWSL